MDGQAEKKVRHLDLIWNLIIWTGKNKTLININIIQTNKPEYKSLLIWNAAHWKEQSEKKSTQTNPR